AVPQARPSRRAAGRRWHPARGGCRRTGGAPCGRLDPCASPPQAPNEDTFGRALRAPFASGQASARTRLRTSSVSCNPPEQDRAQTGQAEPAARRQPTHVTALQPKLAARSGSAALFRRGARPILFGRRYVLRALARQRAATRAGLDFSVLAQSGSP